MIGDTVAKSYDSHRHACLQLKAKEESWSGASVKSCHFLQNHCYLFQNFEAEYGKTGSMPFTFSLEPDTNLDVLSVARYWLVTIIYAGRSHLGKSFYFVRSSSTKWWHFSLLSIVEKYFVRRRNTYKRLFGACLFEEDKAPVRTYGFSAPARTSATVLPEPWWQPAFAWRSSQSITTWPRTSALARTFSFIPKKCEPHIKSYWNTWKVS